ncbi:hypothetical protein [Paenibacillus spongiae]|uniref:Uncharacterized protein n=1 Tax=Paenibacillus spongiae TaxID=2909671 RepID=A0ABY5SC71_9BACL|nr:hypothetical protein [Paenibacillus spongiae]UVI31369.1 hypothetical protein L1F29_05970 [Paenibacillus spongiae]
MKVPSTTGLSRNSRIDRISHVVPYAYYPYLTDDPESLRDESYGGTGCGLPRHVFQTLKEAADAAAVWLEESRQLRRAADRFKNQDRLARSTGQKGSPFEPEASIRTLVYHMNRLHAAYNAGEGVLDPSLKKAVGQALSRIRYERIGLSELPDGSWALHDESFQAALEDSPDDIRSLIASRTDGIAACLVQTLDRYDRMPLTELLNPMAPGLEALISYRSSMEAYMQSQLSGLVVNHRA